MTILCPTILSRAFGVRRDADSSSGSCLIIKTLVEGSIDDIKKVVLSPGFALAVTQMQHLDLSREVRRSRNRQLIFCLGNSQSEAFATLKNMMNVETARQIIQDFEHSNTKMNRLADIIEDLRTPLKKICDEAKCFVTCGVYNWKQTFTCCAETTQLASVGILPFLASFGSVVLSYLDVTKDTALVIKLISLIGVQIFTEPAIFQSVVIWLLIASIVVPLLKSAIETALCYPHAVLDSSASLPSGRQLRLLQAAVFCGYFFVPSLLIVNRKKAKLKIEILLEKSKEEFHSAGLVKEEIQEEIRNVENTKKT